MEINKNIYLDSKQIYKIDKLTTEKFLIPSFILMENAGRLSAEFIKNLYKKECFKNILVFCGPGKNGGDGFVVSRYLHIWGFNVKVVVFAKENCYKGDVLLNYKIIKKLKLKILEFKFKKVKKLIRRSNLIIDAIFGIGISRKIEGQYKKAVELINNSQKLVVSLDIPSGIDANTGEVMGVAVKANYTLSFGFLKQAFKNYKMKSYFGKVILLDIGYPKFPNLLKF